MNFLPYLDSVSCSLYLVGLPSIHYSYVKHVKPGMPLFLFNYIDRRFHGLFEAASPGQMSIDPYAWSNEDSLKTPFPAQVSKFYCWHRLFGRIL